MKKTIAIILIIDFIFLNFCSAKTDTLKKETKNYSIEIGISPNLTFRKVNSKFSSFSSKFPSENFSDSYIYNNDYDKFGTGKNIQFVITKKIKKIRILAILSYSNLNFKAHINDSIKYYRWSVYNAPIQKNVYLNEDVNFKLNSISLGVGLEYQLLRIKKFHFSAGAYMSKNQISYSSKSTYYLDYYKKNLTSFIKPFSFTLILNSEWNIGKNYSILVRPAFTYLITNSTSSKYSQIGLYSFSIPISFCINF